MRDVTGASGGATSTAPHDAELYRRIYRTRPPLLKLLRAYRQPPTTANILHAVSDELEILLRELAGAASFSPAQRSEWASRMRRFQLRSTEEAMRILAAIEDWLTAEPKLPSEDDPALAAALEGVYRAQVMAVRGNPPGFAAGFSPAALASIRRLYTLLGASSRSRHWLLAALATSPAYAGLELFAELAAGDPPLEAHAAAVAFAPLFQQRRLEPGALFPTLLGGLSHPSTAAAVLDLANYVKRKGLVAEHPAAPRAAMLIDLLGQTALRLEQIEEHPERLATDVQEISRIVNEGVTLVVVLCDALALIGERSACGKLYQAMRLASRRVRVEAAAALARLGDEAGLDVLAEMAAEPVVRKRALAYLAELGHPERAAAEWRTPESQAIAELAAWLAEPTQLGLAPAHLEVIDSCVQYWPGYHEPQQCFLIRFEYRRASESWAGIGIAGPLVYALLVDLVDLPPAEIYGTYAGWHAEHEEIEEILAEDLDERDRALWQQIARHLRSQGYDAPELVLLGRFFGEEQFVAEAQTQGQPGVVIYEHGRIHWFPTARTRRPPGPKEVYWRFKGRKLLAALNRQA